MADWTKLVTKHQGDLLRPGEEVVATLLFLPSGGLKKIGIAGGVGGVLGSAGTVAGMKAGEKMALGESEDGDPTRSMADGFPVCFGLISVTSERILVFDRGSSASKRPQRLLTEYPLGFIVGMESKRGFMKRDLTFAFADGSRLTLDGGMAQPYDRFEAAISSPR